MIEEPVHAGIVGQAAALFAVTNIDDIVLLALFFARAAGRRGALPTTERPAEGGAFGLQHRCTPGRLRV
ncbi:hypothetical protein [Nonomuraea aridisoli]|uniref:hypothetical protein n=1 Tax=Nonomuraea aridisoli TaxID=2070368 RepID=UPI001C64A422|nr:hypothetical protein [Nonomuraea aridisoli]